MRYPAYLEVGPTGHCIAYVFSLPGLSLRARRAEEALAALPAAIASELVRLRLPASVRTADQQRSNVGAKLGPALHSGQEGVGAREVRHDEIEREMVENDAISE